MPERRRSAVKLADVAHLAGVSLSTVSRVINMPDIVRPVLRERVRRALSRLEYVPNGAARALASRRNRAIGAIVPTLGIGIFADGVEALQNRLSEQGYTLLLANSQYDLAKELVELRVLLEHGVDGCVLVGDNHLPETHALLRQYRVPCVSTYIHASACDRPAIGFDNRQASYDLARYLIDLGHRQFGIITSPTATNDRILARRNGIIECLADHGMTIPDGQVIELDYSIANGRTALRALLAANPEITAIPCTTDAHAFGALMEAHALGLAVPRDLSVTGFDDLDLASHLDPPLTTIHSPAAELGRRAADHMITAIAGGLVPRSTLLPTNLVIRHSTARPRQTKLVPLPSAASLAAGS